MHEKESSPQPRIEIDAGEGMVLRQLDPADAAEYFRLLDQNREFLNKWDNAAEAYESEENVLKAIQKTGAQRHFGIRQGETLVGDITLSAGFGTGRVGYWVGEEYTKRGYATRALKAVVVHAFEEMNLHTLQAVTRPDNLASKAVLRAAHFEPEPTMLMAGRIPSDKFVLRKRDYRFHYLLDDIG
jgi:[ribosomal protein S5]-alanine N-acetyltransferase